MKKNSRTQALLQKRRSAARRGQALLWSGAVVLGLVGLMVGRLLGRASGEDADAGQAVAAPIVAAASERSPAADRATLPPSAGQADPEVVEPAARQDEVHAEQPSGSGVVPTLGVATSGDPSSDVARAPVSERDPRVERQTGVTAAVRRVLLADADLRLIAGSEGRVNGQLRTVAREFERQERLRAPANSEGNQPASERQQMRRLLLEVDELMDAAEAVPIRYDLTDKLDRLRARGHLLIHLMTIEDLKVPDSVEGLWRIRIESVQHVIAALGNPPNSEAEAREWETASRVLKSSAGLVPAIRAALR